MAKDRASAAFYTGVNGKKYARLQLLTIEGLMDGKQRAEHPDAAPVNFKLAKKVGFPGFGFTAMPVGWLTG